MTVKYASGVPPEWEAGVAALQVRQVGLRKPPSYEIFGPCPRCGDTLCEDISYIVAPTMGLEPARAPIKVRVVCNCAVHHEGAPPGVDGCGASGGVEMTF
jgi:hypothetical protein